MSRTNLFYFFLASNIRPAYTMGEPQRKMNHMFNSVLDIKESDRRKGKMLLNRYQFTRNQEMPKWVWECVEPAWEWICDKYDLDINKVALPCFRWSYNARFDVFYSSHHRYFYGKPHIRLVQRYWWITYKMKTVGRYAKVHKPDKRKLKTLNIIHELTHYVQFIQGRQMSEVETTRNELQYAKEFYPELYAKTELMED